MHRHSRVLKPKRDRVKSPIPCKSDEECVFDIAKRVPARCVAEASGLLPNTS